MLILSNCLTPKLDEGCVKVANSLVRRILSKNPDMTVVTYDRKPEFDSIHLEINKFMLNKELFEIIKEKHEHVLYIPFPAREWATALRIFILSRVCKKRLTVVFTMLCKCGFVGRMLLKLSGARIVTFSQNTEEFYRKTVGVGRVEYLKTGVDTKRFAPVCEDEKKSLRQKYGLAEDRPIILHVGHLKPGRNIAELMKLDEKYQVVLVVSTLTRNEQDDTLRKELLACPNIKIFDEYIPNIEELYQLSDLYFFPVVAEKNCIDVPLSCIEAAACNKPVVTTAYGEMASFSALDGRGFWFIKSFDKDSLNELVTSALEQEDVHIREQVLDYDWSRAVSYLEGLE